MFYNCQEQKWNVMLYIYTAHKLIYVSFKSYLSIIFMQEKCFESVGSTTDSRGVSLWIRVNYQAAIQHSPNSHG